MSDLLKNFCHASTRHTSLCLLHTNMIVPYFLVSNKMHVHSLGAMHQQDKTSLACSTYTVSKPRFSGVNEIHTYAPSESTRTAFFCCLQGNLIKHRSPCVDSRKTNLCSLGSLVPGVELRSRLIVARIYDADILVLAVGYIFRTIMIPVDGLNGFGVIII